MTKSTMHSLISTNGMASLRQVAWQWSLSPPAVALELRGTFGYH